HERIELVPTETAPKSKKEVKLRVPRNAFAVRFFLGPIGRITVAAVAITTILVLGIFTFYYSKYSKIIDRKLQAGPFANSAKIFGMPLSVAVGDSYTPAEIAAELRRSGYSEFRSNPVGYYQLRPNAIEVFPGPESYFDQEAGVLKFAGGKIAQVL